VAACKAQGQLIQDLPKPLTIADGLQGGSSTSLTEIECSHQIRLARQLLELKRVAAYTSWLRAIVPPEAVFKFGLNTGALTAPACVTYLPCSSFGAPHLACGRCRVPKNLQ
jgi:hypothetical protein